jgi:lipoprotein-anchoring transpeptidase ErfK/SrfK
MSMVEVIRRHFFSGLLLVALLIAPPTVVAQQPGGGVASTVSSGGPTADATPQNAESDRARAVAIADRQLFYVAGSTAMLYNAPDSTRPVRRLPITTPVHRLSCEDDWCRVRTDDGKTGYLPEPAISNVWIRASKADRRVYLYRGTRLMKTFKADFGYNAFSDKERRGSTQLRDHWRTPEGQFYVVRRNPNSQFYKALVLNYPTASDARRGYRNGLISRAERDAIIQADESTRMPPMNTELGGWVEIHGDGTGAATNWTQGCVAVTNDDMNTLWWWTQVGTPVLVE